ncbi:hypothetical protein LIER_13180 [Lithospermum erythrorhizon]|uniref:G protein gamma domain-containing protein n=1 Tax=Lithospermum erythrorhizon TaxID=34254 RepID=A0AAV3PWQ8_LITER
MDSFPAPKSPPDYAHLYEKRQQMVKVQALEREIAILEEEIKALDGIPLASSCCKELDDFVEENTDPLVFEINEEVVTSNCFHKRQGQKSGTKFSWNCSLCCSFAGHTQCCSCPILDETECSCSRCSSCLKSCTLKLFCPCCSCCMSKSCCRNMKRCLCCCCCCRKSCCSCFGFH